MAQPTKEKGGLVYWLPKRDIKVTVTVAVKEGEGPTTEVTAESGDMYPDYSRRFVLDYESNWIGTNDLKVQVNRKGLLGSVTAETTVKLSEVLVELAKPRITTTKAAANAVAPCPVGTYHLLIDATADANGELCGYRVDVKRWGKLPAGSSPKDITGAQASGIYYRQELPYWVRITLKGATESECGAPAAGVARKGEAGQLRCFLVFSPSESPVYLLPVRETLFSNNKADFVFSEGVPTQYNQTTDGELIALLKLPADVIGAYFGAMGELFKYRKSALDSEQQYLDAQAKLAVEIVKLRACREAIAAGKQGDALADACPADSK